MTTIAHALNAIDHTPAGTPVSRQALKDLGAALRSEDLDGARQAYVQVIRNAPEGATWNPDGAFAEVGRALKAGNIEAAREAAKAGLQALRPDAAPVNPGVPGPATAVSTTGGTAGTLLNVVA